MNTSKKNNKGKSGNFESKSYQDKGKGSKKSTEVKEVKGRKSSTHITTFKNNNELRKEKETETKQTKETKETKEERKEVPVDEINCKEKNREKGVSEEPLKRKGEELPQKEEESKALEKKESGEKIEEKNIDKKEVVGDMEKEIKPEAENKMEEVKKEDSVKDQKEAEKDKEIHPTETKQEEPRVFHQNTDTYSKTETKNQDSEKNQNEVEKEEDIEVKKPESPKSVKEQTGIKSEEEQEQVDKKLESPLSKKEKTQETRIEKKQEHSKKPSEEVTQELSSKKIDIEDDDDPTSFFGVNQNKNAHKMLSEIDEINEKANSYLITLIKTFDDFHSVKSQINKISDSSFSFLLTMMTKPKRSIFISNINQAFLLEVIAFYKKQFSESLSNGTGIKFLDLVAELKQSKDTEFNFIDEQSLFNNLETILRINKNSYSNSVLLLFKLRIVRVQLKYLRKNLAMETNRLLEKGFSSLSSSKALNQLGFEDFLSKVMKTSKQETLNELLNSELLVWRSLQEKEKEKDSEGLVTEDTHRKKNSSSSEASSNSSTDFLLVSGTSLSEILGSIQDFNSNALSVIYNIKSVFNRNGQAAKKVIFKLNKDLQKTLTEISSLKAHMNEFPASLQQHFLSIMNSSKSSAFAKYASLEKWAVTNLNNMKNLSNCTSFDLGRVNDLIYYSKDKIKSILQTSPVQRSYELAWLLSDASASALQRIKSSINYDQLNSNILANINALLVNTPSLMYYYDKINLKSIEDMNVQAKENIIIFASKYLVVESDEDTKVKYVNFRKSVRVPIEKASAVLLEMYQEMLLMRKTLVSKYHNFLTLKEL